MCGLDARSAVPVKICCIGDTTMPMLILKTLCRIALSSLLLGGIAATASAAPSCNAQALNSASYALAIDAVRNLPELAAWSRTHAFPVAFGESFDKQERLEGRCYWSVSVYANRPERLELWHIFYVEVDGKRLLVQDPVSGDTISLQRWRSKGDKSRMA
jgi:hypothetical protein